MNCRMMGKGIGLVVLLCIYVADAVAQPLAQRVEALMAATGWLRTSEVGIAVYDLTDQQPLFRYQAEKLFRPASTEKVITTVTALGELGTDYMFRTQLARTGTLQGDTLKGDLYVVGHFDPEFSEEDLQVLAASAVSAGIRYVEGRLVGDVSLMDSIPWGSGWCWDDAPSAFQPYLSPLMLNRGCVDIRVTPARKGEVPLVEVTPVSDYYTVDNCAVSHDATAAPLRVTRDWMTHQNDIRVTGNAARPFSGSLSVYGSADFFLQTLRYRLRQSGIELAGGVATAPCPSEALLVGKVERPLQAVVERALKESDNLSAEALFFHTALVTSGTLPVRFEQGQEAVGRFMRQRLGLSPEECVIVDGSGLSPYDLISPDLLLEYLRYAAADSVLFPALYAALPIAGIDGTLQHRMKKGKAYRNVRAKTGSVTGVSTLAGYVRQQSSGHRLAFVIFHQNVLSVRQARAFQDQLCEILSE